MILAKNIRYLRRLKQWSQDFVAEKLGYKSYTTIQKWEMGVSEPPLKKLKELSVLFDVDMDDLATKDLEANEIKSNTDDSVPVNNNASRLSAYIIEMLHYLPHEEQTKFLHAVMSHSEQINPSSCEHFKDFTTDELQLVIEYRNADAVQQEMIRRLLECNKKSDNCED